MAWGSDEYFEGTSACDDGLSLDACPYIINSDDWVDWRNGWYNCDEEGK